MMRLTVVMLLVIVSTAARADFAGIFAGGGMWRSDFSGTAISNVGVDGELALNGDTSNYVYFAVEHPIPMLPNVRLERTGISDSGVGILNSSFTYAGESFTSGQSVNTDIDLTSTDVTLYYELVDVGFDFDLGLTARIFQGDLRVDSASEELTGGLPMVYARAKFGLPFTGTYVGADINTIAYGDNQLTDLSLTIGWEIENFILPEFGIEGGYRRWVLELDEDDFDVGVDMELDGVFVNLTAHF